MRIVWTFVWHFLSVLSILVVVAAGIGLHEGVDVYYGENTEAFKAGDEGPHVFQQGGQWVSQTLRGTREEGFWVEEKRHALTDTFQLEVSFPLDRSRFSVQATPEFATPASRYQDSGPVLALSDIEGNYKALRDFLVHARVMDAQLNWTFGEGHLVLLGDFVDRGPSVTQVLWLIYKLEHSARQAGGRVHYILGNHEIKSLQGDLHSSHQKYFNVATILGRQQSELFGDDSFLGRWLMSKNTIEEINGVLFVHGGLHPALAERDHSLDDLNRIVREHYRQRWYPRRGAGEEELLLDTKTGPSWYRGYFKDDLTQEQVEQTLSRFDAKAVVVGHTLNWRVTTLFDKKVFAIDVKHPLDHRESLPPRHAEGLLLEGDAAWRVLEDGSRVEL